MRPVKVRGLRSRASTAGGYVAIEETFLAPLGIAGYNVVCLVDIVSAPTVPFLISHPMLDQLGATICYPKRRIEWEAFTCLLYTSPSPRDGLLSRMPSSA